MIAGTGVMLFAALGGYLVLERSQKQKGSVRFAGRLVGWTVILAGLLGALCQMKCMSSGLCAKPACPIGGARFHQRGWQKAYPFPKEELPPMPPASER